MANETLAQWVQSDASAEPPAPSTDGVWSFGVEERIYVSGIAAIRRTSSPERPVSNIPDDVTEAPQRPRDLSGLRAVRGTNPYLGKRAFAVSYHWEGVVEGTTEDGFSGRLTPVEDGTPRPEKVEFADFDFDDLADPSQARLALPGAVFYWTVGRSTNAAGTITKQSLIRFRGMRPVSAQLRDEAARDAEDLLSELDTK
jgi:hypothetical protein